MFLKLTKTLAIKRTWNISCCISLERNIFLILNIYVKFHCLDIFYELDVAWILDLARFVEVEWKRRVSGHVSKGRAPFYRIMIPALLAFGQFQGNSRWDWCSSPSLAWNDFHSKEFQKRENVAFASCCRTTWKHINHASD